MYKKRLRLDKSRFFHSVQLINYSKTHLNSSELSPAPAHLLISLNKKGQVTVFIILGIILLLALALIVGIQTEIVTFKPEEVFPAEKSQVENYIASCLELVGQEALELVGLQGGYVEVPAKIANDPNLHLKISPQHLVPYWAYGANQAIPPLEQVKKEIDNYIEKNLRPCLFNLEPFQQTYDLVEKSSLFSDTEIAASKVIFKARLDIE